MLSTDLLAMEGFLWCLLFVLFCFFLKTTIMTTTSSLHVLSFK